MLLKVAKRSPIFYELLKIGLNHGTNWKIKRSKIPTFCTTSHALRHTLRCQASLIEDLLQEGYDIVTTTKFQSDSYLSGGRFFSFTQERCMCRPKKSSNSKSQTWVWWYFQDQQQFFTRSKWSSLLAGTNCWSSLYSTLHQISRCIRPHCWICCFQGSQILQRLLLQLSKELCFCSWWFLR